jgi:hypothetical protein
MQFNGLPQHPKTVIHSGLSSASTAGPIGLEEEESALKLCDRTASILHDRNGIALKNRLQREGFCRKEAVR